MPRRKMKKPRPLTTIKVVKPRAKILIQRIRDIAKSSTGRGKLHVVELLAVLDFTVKDKQTLNKSRKQVDVFFKNAESGQFSNHGDSVSIPQIPGVPLSLEIKLILSPVVTGLLQLSEERLELSDIEGISGEWGIFSPSITKIIITPGQAAIY